MNVQDQLESSWIASPMQRVMVRAANAAESLIEWEMVGIVVHYERLC